MHEFHVAHDLLITDMPATTDLLARRYRLADLIARGGMSDVYEAIDEQSGTRVAIKLVRSSDPTLAGRMAQEAGALERIDHSGLVRLLDTGLEGDHAFLVMELVEGPTLAALLRGGPLSVSDTAALGATLADALAYVHSLGIVHRDVKPSNILLTNDGQGKLADFGIARVLDAATLTLAGTTLGTAAYMAPEQLEDHHVGPSADIWSLGIVLLECLTGKRVYGGSPSEVVARRLAGPVALPDHLPVPWRVILSGMLDSRPDQRLGAAQTAALLAASPLSTSGDGSPSSDAVDPTLTLHSQRQELAPGPNETVRIPTVATSVAPLVTSTPHRRRWVLGTLSAVAIVSALFIGLGFGFFSPTPSQGHKPAGTNHVTGGASRTNSRSTTSTSTTSTIQGTNAPEALATLVRDLATATEGGGVDSNTAQAISASAEKAVSDQSAGNPTQAGSDLQAAAQVIASAIERGSISPTEGQLLQDDLSTLATKLGLSAADTSPTTTSVAGNTGAGTTGAGNTGVGNTGAGNTGSRHDHKN